MGKICLITGITGGIGTALAKVFHDANYSIVGTDRAENSSSLPCDAYIPMDLEQYAEDETYAASKNLLFRTVFDGRLDVLINNAAVQILGGADNLTRQDWSTTLRVNLLAPFLLIQHFLPELEAVHGCVVNIGSIHSRLTKKNFVAYATSKAALSGITRALAVDLGPRVRVNTIEPAAIETQILKAGFIKNPRLYAKLESYHPQLRIGSTIEVARLALAIAEGGMDFLHGACIGIDGGISGLLHDPD
ncbi:SDR family NAD(P)-dependent oxidoreductase [Desulfomicrobium salsuginis]